MNECPSHTCLPLLLQSSKAARLQGVGGAARNTLRPETMWYHTAVPWRCSTMNFSGHSAMLVE